VAQRISGREGKIFNAITGNTTTVVMSIISVLLTSKSNIVRSAYSPKKLSI
jgi:hypothetical protein